MITRMKNVKKFLNSKSSVSGCCLAFASRFFANFNLALLIKVLLTKKSVFISTIWKDQNSWKLLRRWLSLVSLSPFFRNNTFI